MKKIKYIYVFLIIIIILIFSGCDINNDNSQHNKEKVLSELEFYESKIVVMINRLSGVPENNYDIISSEREISKDTAEENSQKQQSSTGGQSSSGESNSEGTSGSEGQKITITEFKAQTVLKSEQKIDWDYLREQIELINSAWNISINDLYNVNVSNNKILDFSNTLNECILNIKNEDKAGAEQNLVILYQYVVQYLEHLGKDSNIVKIKYAEGFVLKGLSEMENNNWSAAKSNIDLAIEKIEEIIKNYEYMKDKENPINKLYITINELSLSVNKNDRELFLIKYRNLINELRKIN